jgi:hypothetical protein
LTFGATEALKVLAVVLMTIDHVDKYLFNGMDAASFAAGRLAMPLFAAILAHHLARPDALQNGVYRRVAIRLAATGLVASIPFVALGGLYAGWWPLNILWTLFVSVLTIAALDARRLFLALAVAILGGAMVEFWWPAIAATVGFWAYFRRPGWLLLLLVLGSLCALYPINGNFWALGALPVIWVAQFGPARFPRLRWAFYAYYPLHLGALWLIRIPMSNAGYLFF